MNTCPAGKHDMDVVGIRQRVDRPTGECKGCYNDRCNSARRRRTAARRPPSPVNMVRIAPEQPPDEWVDSGFTGRQQRWISALVNWMEYGLCRDPSVDENLFWPQDGETASETSARYAKAIEVCRDCAFIRQCRQYAVENGEQVGVWGGMTPRQREREAVSA